MGQVTRNCQDLWIAIALASPRQSLRQSPDTHAIDGEIKESDTAPEEEEIEPLKIRPSVVEPSLGWAALQTMLRRNAKDDNLCLARISIEIRSTNIWNRLWPLRIRLPVWICNWSGAGTRVFALAKCQLGLASSGEVDFPDLPLAGAIAFKKYGPAVT